MTSSPRSRPPRGLGAEGRALWRDVTGPYQLRADELRVLAQACAEADLIARMAAELAAGTLTVTGSTGQPVASPLLVELRHHRVVCARLLSQLALPDDGGKSDELKRARSMSARKAALARWS